MRNYTILLLITLALTSCGRSTAMSPDTSQPVLDREMMAFPPPIELFSGDAWEPAVDADVSEILNGPGTLGDIGTPWTDGDDHWTVAVALQRDFDGECNILYSFLGEGPFPSVTLPAIITLPPTVIRLPKVAACYFDPDGYDEFIEVAIIFQYWDDFGIDPSDDWELGLVRLFFDPDTFPGSPLNLIELETIPNEAYADIQPDLAYDPATGDLFVVSVVDYNNGDADVWFTWGIRDGDPEDINWEDSYIAQDTSIEYLNSFNPRIDIGKVEMRTYSEQWMVAFTYTGWDPIFGWHVRVNYWAVDETGTTAIYRANDFGWPDPVFGEFPAGNPVCDIGPPDSNHAAMVWNQAKTDEWSNSTVMYADLHAGYLSYIRLHPETDWPSECSAFPSVAVHEYSGPGDYVASVSFLFCHDYVTGIWRAATVQITSEPEEPGTADTVALNSMPTPCVGEWDSGAVVEHNYGMSTALTVYDNDYWMLWSGFNPDPDEWIGGPTSVWGAWGNTD